MTALFYPPRNFGSLPPELCGLERSQALVLPVPYESTTEYRAGTRDGPQAIIDASQFLELFDLELRREICEVGICSHLEVQPDMRGPEQMSERIAGVFGELARPGRIIAMLGGEHSISVGAVSALHRKHPRLSVLQLDAHADLRDVYLGSRYSHACTARRLIEICPLVQVGVRSMSAEEHEFVRERGLRPFYAEAEPITVKTIERIIDALSEDVYITVDLDVLDPSLMAAVGNPEPDGLLWREATELLRAVAEARHVVGFDVVELCPSQGPEACAFLAAQLVYKLIGYTTLLGPS